MSNRRGWRWRVLAVYPDARCMRDDTVDDWIVTALTKYGHRIIGSGCTAPMAWLDAWKRIEERGV